MAPFQLRQKGTSPDRKYRSRLRWMGIHCALPPLEVGALPFWGLDWAHDSFVGVTKANRSVKCTA